MQTMAQPVNHQSIQREAVPEEELQMKPLANSITPLVQREAVPEDEEELQMKSLDNRTLQREALPEEEEELQMKSLDSSTLQREALPEEEEELQMKPMVQPQAGMAATPDLETSINQARGGGQSLADNIRQPMEQAFGADFSGVKVHTDGQSDQLNRSIQARAFTTGQDVFFRSGEYNPGSRGGQELLAHELTHVVQQNGGVLREVQPQTEKGEESVEHKEKQRLTVPAFKQRYISGKEATESRVQRLALFHGGAKDFVDNAITTSHTAKESVGELGTKGMYYWKDDEDAALVSAVIYNPKKEWSVMKIEINEAVAKQAASNTRTLIFPSNSQAPYTKSTNGKKITIYGVHYKFLQENLDNKLIEAKKDLSIEGELEPQYQQMTGREFLDAFDLVISPTKAEEYKHENLRQVRANDQALTNVIYGSGLQGETNEKTKTWEGIINDDDQQKTIVNMGMKDKAKVGPVLRGFNGKKGSSITEV
ncbi:DUF4157 domain-containing protein [Nostoc linckia FACHB-391]|uniref:DUF4157 domain-containing protein n=3 Tax=Nostoc TaxID=1177 RepID=A0ABR8IGK5_9NOSO|nr:DUF4157 domain-containing protein [Nostoc linckia FACHB-391]MBD2650308.1 DUF4157 domain-containing protein [Nostoc foliaceum FACHB-393]